MFLSGPSAATALPGHRAEPSESRAGLVFLLMFLLLAAGIIAAGWLYCRNYEKQFRAGIERQLSVIADLKAGDLAQYRKERLADGSLFFQNAPFAALVRRFLEQPEDADAQRQLQIWLGKYQPFYGQVRLLDARGVTRLSSPAGLPAVSSAVAKGVSDVLRSGQVTMQDFYRSEQDQRIHLGVLTPIFDEQDARRPLGVVFLRMDPETYLYPFIERWPTASLTAETLLVRREGNEAVFLNELRFQTNSALNLRMPLDRVALPAAQAALGREGFMEGVDYRGVPVVAVLRAIPDSPWSLVARMDAAEAYRPMREQLWQVVLMAGVLLFGAGAFAGLLWRRQRVRFYRERAETEDEARRFATVVKDSNDAVTISDFEGQITAWNRGAELMYGYSEEEALQMNIWRITPEAKRAEKKAFIDRLVAGEAISSFETQRVTKDGRILDVWLTVTKLMDQAGKPIGIASTERDITERKRAVEEVHRLNAELEQRVAERTAQLQAVNEELESFGYSVSHDLRAPLRHVMGFADLLQKEAGSSLSEKSLCHLKTISQAAQRMGELIDDLLAFSRAGRVALQKTGVNLDELVRETMGGFQADTTERHIAWEIHPLPAVWADHALLRQALVNLVSNAVKFTGARAEAKIEIGCAPNTNGETVIFIRDNGAGFDPKYASKLFGVFQRLHSSAEFEGTGIGLANVRRVIRRHGGRTWAEGAVEGGATFYFSIPKQKEDIHGN